MTRAELIARIQFALDGHRFGEWTLTEATARIIDLITRNPEAALTRD
jgi:hypothetical protein